MTGTAIIPVGASQVIVSGLGLPGVPSRVECTVRKPDGNAMNLKATVQDGSISADGFSAWLTGAVPAGGYRLDWWVMYA
jgi:hypothetical protein